jgi:nicotinate-nucleotide pyrophosphorylase (carboxylating)
MSTEEIIEKALAEDLGDGDHTTLATILPDSQGMAKLLVKENGILCGVKLAEQIFHKVDPALQLYIYYFDGSSIKTGDIVFEVRGRKASILKAERLVLNFMQRLSGIATATNQVVRKLEGLTTIVLDTRKTTPLMRSLEKYAVKTGGGENHRMGLYDMVLIKDNHVDFSGGIVKAIDAVHAYFRLTGRDLPVEIEVRDLDELQQVLDHGKVDRIMLDNFPPELMKEAIRRIAGRFETEASGGITGENIRTYAETGVDYISMGALTHHINSLDMSLKAE